MNNDKMIELEVTALASGMGAVDWRLVQVPEYAIAAVTPGAYFTQVSETVQERLEWVHGVPVKDGWANLAMVHFSFGGTGRGALAACKDVMGVDPGMFAVVLAPPAS